MIRLGSVFALLLSASVRAECTEEERAATTRQGHGQEQIDALCQFGEGDLPPPAAGPSATYCATPQNFCPLDDPEPAGNSCSCPSPAGPVPGITE